MKSIIYLILLFLVLNSCSKKDLCPPDVILGSLFLVESSKDYLPYNGIDTLEFMKIDTFRPDTTRPDSLVRVTAYLYNQIGLIHDSSRTVVANICVEPENDERSDSFYISEHKTANYFDTDTSRKLRVVGNLGINEDFLSKQSTGTDPVLYDELKLTVHRSNPSISGAVATIEFVANDRGNKDRMSDSLKSRLNKFVILPQINVNGFQYTNVYEYRNGDSLYYYFKPLEGVVAFRDLNNKWWNLIRAH